MHTQSGSAYSRPKSSPPRCTAYNTRLVLAANRCDSLVLLIICTNVVRCTNAVLRRTCMQICTAACGSLAGKLCVASSSQTRNHPQPLMQAGLRAAPAPPLHCYASSAGCTVGLRHVALLSLCTCMIALDGGRCPRTSHQKSTINNPA
jgi:hypothetical protein